MSTNQHHCLCVLAVLVGGANGTADEVSIPPAKDNTLYESPTGALSNGMGRYFFVGTASGSSAVFIRRGVVSFDVAAHVPRTATIDSATLTLHMSRVPSGHKDEELFVHRLNVDWGEGDSKALEEEGKGAPPEPGDATWIHTFFSGGFWQSNGGDFAQTPSGSTLVDDIGFYSWSSPDMAADVQAWVDDPASNFGWILLGNEAVLRTVKRFDSLQHADPAVRPLLRIEFTACYADCDHSTGPGVLDIFDFLCFQNLFVNGDRYACECDFTPACDIFDFLCFQEAFVAGCP